MEHGFIPYGHKCIDEEDIKAVVEALKSDYLTTGPRRSLPDMMKHFHRAFSEIKSLYPARCRIKNRHTIFMS